MNKLCKHDRPVKMYCAECEEEAILTTIPDNFNLDAEPTVDEMLGVLPFPQRLAYNWRQYRQARKAKSAARFTEKVQRRFVKNLQKSGTHQISQEK